MRIFNTFIILFCLFQNDLLYSQSNELGSRVIITSGKFTNSKFYIYSPPFKAKAIYKNQSEAENLFPEQLMSSILSASNQEWVDYNTLGGTKKSDKKNNNHFEEVKKIDINKTFFELYSKLEFNSNAAKMAIVKFYYVTDSKKPVAGAIVMQKENGIWKSTSTSYTTNIAMALMVFKPDIIGRMLKGESINKMEKKILKAVYDENGFSFEKLIKIKLSKEEKEYFTNPLNW